LVFLSFVEPSLVRSHLDCRVVAAADVVELLEFRAIPAGMPVLLDERTMRPVEPVCSWFRHLAYEGKDTKTLREYAYIVLHRYGPALTCRGLRSDPWSGTSARTVAPTSAAVAVVSTPVIPPEQWFPLIRAAWTYVHTFAPDILRAHQRYQHLLAQATAMTPDRDTRLDRWLADPANPIPVHADPHVHAEVNWNLLTLTLGWKATCAATLFGRNRISSLQPIARVEHALAHGHPTTTGVIDDLARIELRDGTYAVWHPGLAPQTIGLELRMLRNACYTLVVGLSMMRDSEKRAELPTHQRVPINAESRP